MKHRIPRVRELIKRELSGIISREFDFEDTLVTVQDVDLTPDLKQCHVHIGAIGSADSQAAAIKKLHEHRSMLQHALSKRVVLKYTPHLHFHLDQSVERGVRVLEILNQIEAPKEEGA